MPGVGAGVMWSLVGVTRQRTWAACRSWERQGDWFCPELPGAALSCWHPGLSPGKAILGFWPAEQWGHIFELLYKSVWLCNLLNRKWYDTLKCWNIKYYTDVAHRYLGIHYNSTKFKESFFPNTQWFSLKISALYLSYLPWYSDNLFLNTFYSATTICSCSRAIFL